MAGRPLIAAFVTACSLLVGACSGGTGESQRLESAAAADTTAPVAPAPTAAAAPPAPPTTADPAPVTPPPPPPRAVSDQSSPAPFAVAGPVTLLHPSPRVEMVGFHQSNHEGARELAAVATTVSPVTLEGRERATAAQSAADIVVDPAAEIRAPVTGVVKRSGGYTLYCKYRDDFVVIAPDANPAWEVKILHINGVQVRAGDRVEAGRTVLAPGPTRLPFDSQVDEVSADPAWPHVHIEVVDPSIPNRPSPGGGC